MPINNGNNQIPLPDVVRAGDSITAKWANSMRTAIQKLRDRKPQQGKGSKTQRILPPFFPSVKLEGSQWQISASRGLVVERILTAGEDVNAIIYHEPNNALTDGKSTYFNINAGESLFVKVLETDNGGIRGGVDLVLTVLPTSTISYNFIAGTQGAEYYYRICDFYIEDGKPKLEKYIAGSHIYHETGLNHDIQFMTCEDPVNYTQTQLGRLTFTSGRLVSVGQSEEDRPLATSNQQIDIASCS